MVHVSDTTIHLVPVVDLSLVKIKSSQIFDLCLNLVSFMHPATVTIDSSTRANHVYPSSPLNSHLNISTIVNSIHRGSF